MVGAALLTCCVCGRKGGAARCSPPSPSSPPIHLAPLCTRACGPGVGERAGRRLARGAGAPERALGVRSRGPQGPAAAVRGPAAAVRGVMSADSEESAPCRRLHPRRPIHPANPAHGEDHEALVTLNATWRYVASTRTSSKRQWTRAAGRASSRRTSRNNAMAATAASSQSNSRTTWAAAHPWPPGRSATCRASGSRYSCWLGGGVVHFCGDEFAAFVRTRATILCENGA